MSTVLDASQSGLFTQMEKNRKNYQILFPERLALWEQIA
ncbi:MAG: hypothetical protein K0Q55_2135 [Verrucomicrobia bacterium]|jgi:hypothetical protein|nr:hypothetical protein [Verrucomicrobiota bacterium]